MPFHFIWSRVVDDEAGVGLLVKYFRIKILTNYLKLAMKYVLE